MPSLEEAHASSLVFGPSEASTALQALEKATAVPLTSDPQKATTSPIEFHPVERVAVPRT